MYQSTNSKSGYAARDRARSSIAGDKACHSTPPAFPLIQPLVRSRPEKSETSLGKHISAASAIFSRSVTVIKILATSLFARKPRYVAELTPFQRVIYSALCDGQYGYADVTYDRNAVVIDRRGRGYQ